MSRYHFFVKVIQKKRYKKRLAGLIEPERKLGLDRVIEVLEEEIVRIDSYCDDFTRDYEAWGRMEAHLDKLKKIQKYIKELD